MQNKNSSAYLHKHRLPSLSPFMFSLHCVSGLRDKLLPVQYGQWSFPPQFIEEMVKFKDFFYTDVVEAVK